MIVDHPSTGRIRPVIAVHGPDDYYFFRPPPDSFLFYGHQKGTRDEFFRGEGDSNQGSRPLRRFGSVKASYVLLTAALLELVP